jgi:hypothetical protein
MSSEQSPLDHQTVEQTKQQIRSLVGEIAQLSKSDVRAEEYYAAFMQRIVSALAAVGGAVWLLGESRRLELAYQMNLSQTLLDPNSAEATRHLRLLSHVCQSNEPQLVPPLSGTEGEAGGGNPTEYLLVLAPLVSDNKPEGVIEVFQRPDSQPTAQRGYLRFLIQMCELAGEWLKSRKLKHFSDRHSLWAQADQFARMVHENLDVRETAYVITNEGRRLIGCDRVSVAIKRGRVCKVESVSGQDTIENRSNIVTSLGRVATRVVATGEPLWYEGVTDDLPPQVEEAVDEYVDESYAKSVVVLPLRKPDDPHEVPAAGGNAELVGEVDREREVIGALIIEQIETDLPREILEPRIDMVYEHGTRALANALDHHSVFLMPLWKTIGKSSLLVKGRNLPKTLIAAGAILAVILALLLIRTDFKLESEGTLQPAVRRDVFFDIGGTITKVHVKDSSIVKQGDVLIELVNHELEQEWEKTIGQLHETKERLDSLRRAKVKGNLTPSQEAQISGEYMQLVEREKTLVRQQELIEEKRSKLLVRSPIDGQVLLPWDADQSLLHRPVTTGQKVMTIADPSGPWELELAMPERRMGHLTKARHEKLSSPENQADAGTDAPQDLPVSYILATDSSSRKYGHIKEVYGITQVKGEEGPTVKITVAIDSNDLSDEPRLGTTVTANVHCGRCSLGYSWFHEVAEWVQKHILF